MVALPHACVCESGYTPPPLVLLRQFFMAPPSFLPLGTNWFIASMAKVATPSLGKNEGGTVGKQKSGVGGGGGEGGGGADLKWAASKAGEVTKAMGNAMQMRVVLAFSSTLKGYRLAT